MVYDGFKRLYFNYIIYIKNENHKLISFNGQSKTFRLSIKED